MKRVIFTKSSTLGRRLLSSAAGKSHVNPTDFTIPSAIKRSPTAVLEALSSTVGVDPTAPHFSFIDDPAMIPSTNKSKQMYFFAKEMGKRAARQLAEEWPTLFAFDRDQPELPIYRPQKAADPLKVDPTEENLSKMIKSREVKDAVMLYERMRTENLDVSEKVQLELFKLACYYNGNNVPFAEFEEWHGLRNMGKSDRQEWTQGGVADLLFESLPKTGETVSTLICGLCKHRSDSSLKRAKDLYDEYLPKKWISKDAFEARIKVVSWTDAQAVLKDMKSAGVKPSLTTMNSLLHASISAPKRQTAIKQIVGEMNAMKIVLSLTSYKLIIGPIVEHWPTDKELEDRQSGKYKNVQLALSWLVEMLDELARRDVIEIQESKDYDFFYLAMNAARRAQNLGIAEKILNLYESDKNKVKMSFFDSEDGFYRNYLALYIDSNKSIEDITEKYKSFVPRLVGGNRVIAHRITEKLKIQPHWPLLCRIVEDGITSRFITDNKSAASFRNSLIAFPYQNLSPTERDEYRELIQRLVDIWVELSNFTEEFSKRLQVKFSPQAISECALLLNRVGESERGYKMLEMLLDIENSQGDNATIYATGHARQSAMAELFETALEEKDVYKASICLEVMGQYTPRAKLEPLAKRIHSACKLTEDQTRIIDGFVRLRPE